MALNSLSRSETPGDCLPYLIACLKAHLHVLEVGLAEQMAVVHARSWAVR